MTPIINLTIKEGWQVFNQSCQDCSKAYLDAYSAVKQQLGIYLLFFAVAVVLSAVIFRLYDKGKISEKRFKWTMTIIIGVELLWAFNLIGLYYMAV